MDVDIEQPPAPELPQPGRTLLPGPVAQAVSLATRSTCLAIRVGSAAGSYGLGAARITTLSSLELARSMVEGVLSRAGRDTLARSRSDLATMDAESVIEKSLENLHRAMTQVVFWTTAGFHLTSTSFSMASDFSQLFLSSLDQVLGSTDSSRAIASIVTLIRHEFRDPATGLQGDKVGVIDLVLGLSALAYLQQHCWRCISEENRRHQYEEVVWDVVVLNDGERVDVQVSNAQANPPSRSNGLGHSGSTTLRPKSSQGNLRNGGDDDEAVVRKLKDEIADTLPQDTTVTISNAVTSTQIITIDVDGPGPISLPTPSGAEVVETIAPRSPGGFRPYSDNSEASYRVVYKLERNKFGTTSLRNCEEQPTPQVVELFSDTEPEPSTEERPKPTVPRVSSPSTARPRTPRVKSPTTPSPPSTFAMNTKASMGRSRSSPNALHSPTTSPQNENAARPKTPNASSRPSSSLSKQRPEREANQKKHRVPLDTISSRNKAELPRQSSAQTSTASRKVLPKRKTDPTLPTKSSEKKASLKQALKESSQSLSNMWHKDSTAPDNRSQSRLTNLVKKDPPIGSTNPRILSSGKPLPSIRSSSLSPYPVDSSMLVPRSPSRSSYVSVHERRRDSIVSQTDTYSIHSSSGLRPSSPTFSWTDTAAESSFARTSNDGATLRPSTPTTVRGHRRITSHVPSLYSLASNDSQSSLVLASCYQNKSAYSAADALSVLRREGAVDGIFPRGHVLHNVTRYMRFSSASYGSNFLKFMGISEQEPVLKAWDGTHTDVRHFVQHTESDTGSLLLASFVDPQGGSDSSGSTGTGVPLVHYISLDHDARAVVLACRGTLGFEDVLADMTCDYDNLSWRGRPYKVHKGVHASARRLLYGGDGRVLITLREALLEFPDYGIVLCGHSLGGAVTALLGVMLSEPNPAGTGFVTSSKQQDKPGPSTNDDPSQVHLPAGRPIHVYAYGPPGTMSSTLRKLTRGLITSVVHGNDLVPYLSLGVLHDFQAIALAFKQDQHQAKIEIRQRLWHALQGGIAEKWYHKAPQQVSSEDEAKWSLPVLQALRASMTSTKLLPPGEVFTVETQRVLRRDAFLLSDEDHIGKPAQRIVLKYIKDVEARFREVRFGTSMLIDHSPAKYEEALDKLRVGVVL